MITSDRGILRLIATSKFVKVALLISVGVGIFKSLHTDLACTLEHWITMLGLNPGNQFIEATLTKAANLSPHKVKFLGAGSFIYAGLFLTEGVGLWMAKRWGEWITVIITGSLVPVEIYEIFRRLSVIKILALITNLAIVAYLVYRIRNNKRNPSP
jgi:uncharacterized membrane protein (DUF2068 family)